MKAFDTMKRKIEAYCSDRAEGILASYGYSSDEIDGFDEIVQEGVDASMDTICRWESYKPGNQLSSLIQTRAKRGMRIKVERMLNEGRLNWCIGTEYLCGADDMAERLMDISTMLTCVRTLTPREQEVLEIRYGLNSGTPKTLEETALAIGLTSRERVRQIEVKALRKLRSRLPKLNREVV